MLTDSERGTAEHMLTLTIRDKDRPRAFLAAMVTEPEFGRILRHNR
jgi:hypothetical protein